MSTPPLKRVVSSTGKEKTVQSADSLRSEQNEQKSFFQTISENWVFYVCLVAALLLVIILVIYYFYSRSSKNSGDKALLYRAGDSPTYLDGTNGWSPSDDNLLFW